MENDYRNLINKSDANFELAHTLRDGKKYNEAANRLYYSLFQVVKVYAVKKGKMRIDDRDRVHGIAKEIVKSDDRQFGRIYGDAENYRITADYLLEDVGENDLDLHFVNDVQTLRDHYKKLAQSA